MMTVFAHAENAGGFTLEEMEAKFHEAEQEAAMWFSCAEPIPTDEHSNPTQEQLTSAGYTAQSDTPKRYWQVIGTNSIEEIREKLSKYFTQDVINYLMIDKKEFRYYFECDGKLYWHGEAGQYGYDSGKYEFKIASQTENKVVLHLDYYHGYIYTRSDTDFFRYIGSYDYVYEKQEDGTWKFATYEMPMAANPSSSSLYQTYFKNKRNPQTGDNGITAVIALCAVSAVIAVAFKKKKILG